MAGLFAVRALRAGREKFDPFGERSSSSDDDDDDLDGVDEPAPLTAEEEERFSTAPKVKSHSHWEFDAAEVIEDATATAAADAPGKPPAPLLATFATVWETPCELIYEDDEAEVFCVRWSPDDALLAVGCGDGVVRVFHAADGRLAYNLEREGDVVRLPTTCLRWRPVSETTRTKNVLLAANADGTVCHWHVTSRKCMHTISEEGNQVYALDYSQDGALFATGGKDYSVRVYDEATKSVMHTLATGWIGAPSGGHSNRIFSIKFSPDNPTLLYSGGWDNTIQVRCRRSSPGPH